MANQRSEKHQPFFTRRAYLYTCLALASAALVALGAAIAWSSQTQNGWRCFDQPHDPNSEQQLFIGCIVEKTRRDMARNPHLYGELFGKPEEVAFEFLGARADESGDHWVGYNFRYQTRAGPYCRSYFPDEFGRYHLQSAYPETDKPGGRCT